MISEGSAFGRAQRMADRAGGAAKRPPEFTRPAPGAADGAAQLQDWRANQVREWLLLLLRFAIMRDPRDEVAALIIAKEIDSLGRQLGRSAPTFFRRSSSQIRKAVAALGNSEREAILKQHIARIDHLRLRSAFQAAVQARPAGQQARSGSRPHDLWTDLGHSEAGND
jgi:hypothetical protein